MEKLLVTQALDERDLLIKKINDKIDKIKAVDIKRVNTDTTFSERQTKEDFSKNVKAAYQQIKDLIKRYQRLDAAIVKSNSKASFKTSRGEMTVAEAISIRSRLHSGNYEYTFEDKLIENLTEQYSKAVKSASARNTEVENKAHDMRNSILGRDFKSKDDLSMNVVEEYIKQNTTEVIDPLNINDCVANLREETDAFLKEIETQIKVSNATTTIEF